MADPTALKPTGRRVRGYISDLVELSGPRSLWTAVVYHDDYRSDPALEAGLDRSSTFVAIPMVAGLVGLAHRAPGVYLYDTGEIRTARELLGAAPKGIGWRGALELFVGASRALAGAREPAAISAGSLPSHGSVDPHRVCVGYDGKVQVVGYGLPRLDLLDFLDDPSLVPPIEALRFTAPESIEGSAEDFTTDLFVLALITVELATGQPVYAGKDARSLLAVAAEGEARALLRERALPAGVDAAFGAALEPWPDDRPSTPTELAERIEALLPSLSGLALAGVMESLAEIASDVEVDLPAGWTLPAQAPAAPPPDPKVLAAARDRASAAADVASGAARAAQEAVQARAPRPEDSAEPVQAALTEALHHAEAASRASQEAATARDTAQTALDAASISTLAQDAEDAADRARGADAETRRALTVADRAADRARDEAVKDQARQAAQAGLRDRVAALGKTLDALRDQVDQADKLAPAPSDPEDAAVQIRDAIARVREARESARAAHAGLGADLDEAAVRTAERTVRAAHKAAEQGLGAARAARADLDRERAENLAREQALAGAARDLQELTRRAAEAAGQAAAAIDGLGDLEHAGSSAVADAIRQARRAGRDARDAAEILSRFELEPGDDPDAVLDAARTHLQSATNATSTALAAAQTARAADAEVGAAHARELASRKVAADRHRAALAETGVRVETAVATSEAALAAALTEAGDLADTEPVATALDVLREHVTALAARRANWTDMAGPAGGLEDPDELEGLVHTGLAEAGFAESDASDLPPLQTSFARALAQAREARLAAEAAREQALSQARAAVADAEREATGVASLAADDPLARDAPEPARQDADLREAARAFANAVARCGDAVESARAALGRLEADGDDPSDAIAAYELAKQAGSQARAAHQVLVEGVRAIRKRLEAEAEARRVAMEAAGQARERIDAALAEARVELPVFDDEAVADRVAPVLERLQRALAAVPADVRVDPEDDPHEAREILAPLAKQAIAAAREVRAAHKALLAAHAEAVELVAALRDANARAGAAADRSAAAAAAARELIAGFQDASSPEAEAILAELRDLATVADEAATRANEASEAASDAKRPADASHRAGVAEAAATVADEALEEARSRATALAEVAQIDRARRDERDRAERETTLGQARRLLDALATQRARLDHAVQRAATALTDRPSPAAREAWDTAEVSVDAATRAFERADTLYRQVAEAASAPEASQRQKELAAEITGLPAKVQVAADLAAAAAEVAERDASENAAVIAAIGEQVGQIRERIVPAEAGIEAARASLADEVDGAAELVAKLTEQRTHLTDALADAEGALGAAPNALDPASREALTRRARAAWDRAAAASNTAAALTRRVEQGREAHVQRLEARRKKAADAAHRVERSVARRGETLSEAARAALERHAGMAELEGARAEIERALNTLTQAHASLAEAAARAAQSASAREAEDALEATQALAGALDDPAREVQGAIDRAEQTRTDAERARAEELNRARAAHAALVQEADAAVARGGSLLDTARSRVEQARVALAGAPGRAASSAWTEAHGSVEAAGAALDRARAAHQDLPREGADPDGVVAILEVVRAAVDEVRQRTSSVEPTLADALRSAQALAGILDEAAAVRARQAGLRDRLADARTRLDLATRAVEGPRVLQERDRARAQLEELEQSMTEADTSLRELGEASSEEEASALLEVAAASIDIAASVFELAIPVVDHAITLADAETFARRSREEAVERAAQRIRLAGDLPQPTAILAELAELVAEADALPDRALEVVEGRLSAMDARERAQLAARHLHAAHERVREAVAQPLDRDPAAADRQADDAEAAREAASAALAAIHAEVHGLRLAVDAVREAEQAREERIAAAAARRSQAAAAVQRLRELVPAQRAEAEAIAAPHPLPCRPALDAVIRALDEILASDAGPQPTHDSEAAAQEAAGRAELSAQTASAVPVDARLAELRDAAARAEADARQAQAALDAARAQIASDRSALDAHLAAIDDALLRADTHPDAPPEALARLAEARALRATLERPDPLDDGADLQSAVANGVEVAFALDAARALDPEALLAELAEITRAVTEARAARQLALDSARDRLAAARQRLAERQEEGETLREDLTHASAVAEAESAWNELRVSLDALAALAIGAVPLDAEPEALAGLADAAEAAAATPFELDTLAEAVRQALIDAHDAQEAARARLDAAHDMLARRIDQLDQALDDDDLPETPPVAAARLALAHAASRLRGVALPAPLPEHAPTAALRKAADKAEAALSSAFDRDVDGLIHELARAVATARAASVAEEDARAETQAAAVHAADSAILELEGAVSAGQTALEQAPRPEGNRATAKAHRSAARDALELARSRLGELRTLRLRLETRVRSEVAIAVSFDAEAAADAAREALAEHSARVEALVDELRRLDAAIAGAPAPLRELEELEASLAATLEDAPDPRGPDAEAAYAALYEAGNAMRAAVQGARAAAEPLGACTSAREAESLLERIRSAARQAHAALDTARARAAEVRAAGDRFLEREAAARAEALGAARERILLAAERAARAVEDIAQALDDASEVASRSAGDAQVGAQLTRIALANDRALQASDAARAEDPARPQIGADLEASAERARALADEADQAAEEARAGLAAIRERVVELERDQIAARERDAASRLAQRDSALPRLRTETEALIRDSARLRGELGESSRDPTLELARNRLSQALDAADGDIDRTREALGLLDRARPDDVKDFLRDADAALAEARQTVGFARSSATALLAERETSRTRSAELEIEEHRGRAWEACKALRAIAAEFTRARAALGETPETPSAGLRESLDRLAEVERRLWRAGQRADEAREKAGSTKDLQEARDSADVAEKALGAPGRWEREIDTALQEVTAALREEPQKLPENDRMRQLRRGRNQDGEEDPHERLRKLRDQEVEQTDVDLDSPTEALLKRLRHGRSTGETGRERLKRLREGRKEDVRPPIEALSPEIIDPPALPKLPDDAATNKPAASEYGSLADFEDLRPTRIDAPSTPEPAATRRADLMARLRSRSKVAPEDPGSTRATPKPVPRQARPRAAEPPEDDGRTLVFDKTKMGNDAEDAATQMFTREMLDALMGEQEDLDDEE